MSCHTKSLALNICSLPYYASSTSTHAKDKWIGKTDPSSFSNPEDFRTLSFHLKWKVDFSLKILSGSVELTLQVLNESAKELILDTRDLEVIKVSHDGKDLSFKIGGTVNYFGEPLTIQLAELPQTSKNMTIQIHYKTTANCTGLHWLSPSQTIGKKHPYLFNLCQPIHARSFLPCQDTPSVKAPYTAEVSVPRELRALMSALPLGEPELDRDNKNYRFHQRIPIPSYLIGIAVGAIVGKGIGPRSKVWAEKELVDQAALEFSDTERMIQAAEKLAGEYVWGQYDILVLPPSFTGGMEHPCLTFVSSTLLTGDKSMAYFIAHEIAHSWTGNLVTNADWQHFWLNEGLTVFLERKILAALHGEAFRQLISIGGWAEMVEAITEMVEAITEMKEDNPLTSLVVDLNGVDPDDGFSMVPYEKGYAFLYYLEEKVGGSSEFEPFLLEYIQNHRFKSIDTDVFKADFINHFQKQKVDIGDINWDVWLYTPGMPPVRNEYDQTLKEACSTLKNRWLEWEPNSTRNPFHKSEMDLLLPEQRKLFLQNLLDDPNTLPLVKLKIMGEVYEMEKRKNIEIRFRWLRLNIRVKNPASLELALKFVNEQGRLEFSRPIYKELYAWEEVRAETVQNYKDNRKNMMHVLAKALLQDLHI